MMRLHRDPDGVGYVATLPNGQTVRTYPVRAWEVVIEPDADFLNGDSFWVDSLAEARQAIDKLGYERSR